MIVLTAVIVVIVTPVVLVTAFFAVEVMAGLRPLRVDRTDGFVPRTAIVVPAHNEEGVIAETVRGLVAAAPGASVVVIADNCTDGTAASAREEGAHVLVRDEPDRRRLFGTPRRVVELRSARRIRGALSRRSRARGAAAVA